MTEASIDLGRLFGNAHSRRGGGGPVLGAFKLDQVPAGWVADVLARLQVRCPEVQVVFADSRKFAEECSRSNASEPPSCSVWLRPYPS